MLTDYLNAAMHAAHYELIEGDTAFYAEIPGFQGVYANAATLEACRDELREVLEEWVLLRVSRKLSLPAVNGLELRITEIA
ncbi:MAG: type II toxin-antitoxin system HicB family antitoxin [Ardenticatenales bacterium]|nr:type II toxin-antitoxin system HicB family antitoxin [Ardenticatenales bacterium]